MAELNLQQKFPLMTPAKSAPALFRLNGCGFALYGSRDRDSETGSWVATWCLSLVFLPVLCLSAYRVAAAPGGGWYFLGREPLSSFAKTWNWIAITAIAAIVGIVQFNLFTNTSAYKAQRQMATAQTLVEYGHIGQAAAIYQDLAVARADQSREATTALAGLLDQQCHSAPLAEAARVYAAAVTVARRGTSLATSDVMDRGLTLATDRGDSDPQAALAILNSVRPLARDPRPIDERRLPLLRKWAAVDPSNLAAIVPLASALDQRGQLAEAKKLLLPVKTKLAHSEGARVLGMILAHDGDLDGAYALLWPYVKERLDRLHNAESLAELTGKRLYDRELRTLREHKGPHEFYSRYDAAPKDQQPAIVDEYLNTKVRNDPEYTATRDALEKEASVVPVALDLGIVMLQRGQAQTDPAKRKSQLHSTEEIFLAIGGFAGETDAYRLSLAQVYYWLGKQTEGRKLFNEFLQAKHRSFDSLMMVGTKMRELGADRQARVLSEEAYKKTGDAHNQNEAARLRSLCPTSLEDQITWLTLCDPTDPTVKASLAKSIGYKAFNEGRDNDAVTQYRAAIDAFAALPRSATTLNESALAYYAIYSVTGDKASFERCADSFQQAVDLAPGDPILLYNAGTTLLDGALADVIGKDIDLRALRQSGSTEMLGYLYRDEATRKATANRVQSSDAVSRALSFLDKAMLLSPKSLRSYELVYEVRSFTHDLPALKSLDKRMRDADVDTSEDFAHFKEFQSGTRDRQNRTAIAADLKRDAQRVPTLRAAGGPTLAICLARQADHLLALDYCGDHPDITKAIALANEAYKIAPSSQTLATALAAQLAAVEKDLCSADPAFDGFCKRYQRTLSATHLIALVASESSPFQKELFANEHFKQALSLIRHDIRRFPEGAGVLDWACLKVAAPSEAARVAECIRNNDRIALETSMDCFMHPAHPGEAVQTYWLMQIYNKPAEAHAAIKKITDQGIAMPIK